VLSLSKHELAQVISCAFLSEEVLAAIRNILESAYFVWDGIDEDERLLTTEELLAGIAAMEAQRGKGSDAEAGKPQNTQEQTWPQ
jgi:hypothetical protein